MSDPWTREASAVWGFRFVRLATWIPDLYTGRAGLKIAEHEKAPSVSSWQSRRTGLGVAVSTYTTRPAAALQAATPPDCRHSKEPFDTAFACITSRRDLSDGAKLLHAKLVSMRRLGAAWTQTMIGAAFGWSRQKVWRCTAELSAAGLVVVIRHGQGRPNSYVLLGIGAADLDGTRPRARAGHQDARPPVPPGRVSFNGLKEGPKNRNTGAGYGDFPFGSRAAWVSRYGPLTMG